VNYRGAFEGKGSLNSEQLRLIIPITSTVLFRIVNNMVVLSQTVDMPKSLIRGERSKFMFGTQ